MQVHHGVNELEKAVEAFAQRLQRTYDLADDLAETSRTLRERAQAQRPQVYRPYVSPYIPLVPHTPAANVTRSLYAVQPIRRPPRRLRVRDAGKFVMVGYAG